MSSEGASEGWNENLRANYYSRRRGRGLCLKVDDLYFSLNGRESFTNPIKTIFPVSIGLYGT